MSATSRSMKIRTQDEMWGLLGGTVLALAGAVWAVLWAGHTLAGAPTEGGFLGVLSGRRPWLPEHTAVLVAAALAVAVLGPLLWWVDRRVFGPRARITRAAKYLAQPWQARTMWKDFRRKEIRSHGGTYDLLFLGFLSRTRRRLYFGPEDTGLIITGPRQNKSSSIANPAIIEAPGACLATSNKPGVVSDTVDHRPGPIYIFDPQNIYRGPNPAPMYWDPLTYITEARTENMVERASALAERILFASGGVGTSDPHWGNAAIDIMKTMLLAAALDRRPITDVYLWVLAPNDTTPLNILERDGRFPVMARTLDEYAHGPADMRGSEYGSAKTALGFLSHDSIRPWITPTKGRTEFRPSMMVAGGQPTLYVLSKEGSGSAGALTAALTIAVAEAAEEESERHGGRLPVPMMLVLDEVANVCKWETLPEQYTHYGSKGILPIAFLQNYPQGKAVWGEDRMKQLLDAAAIFITGGGIKDNGFHRAVAEMVAKRQEASVSESYGKHGRSTSRSYQEKPTIVSGDLRELPKGYSMMFVSGIPPILLRHVPTWRRGYKTLRTEEAPAPQVSAPVTRWDGPRTPAPVRAKTGWNLTLQDDS